ncbi:MAG: NnrS family protein [Bryobacteraceae bacterium]
MSALPPAWVRAFERDRAGAAQGAGPLPERRIARLLAAFIACGLVFMTLPGTLLGVWTLIGISSRRAAEAVPAPFIQAHGHAQLFGWVATFIIGISLYTFPKFRGANLRSLAVGWAMFGVWTAAVAARWASGLWGWHWRETWPVSAAAELAVALLLVWQITPRGRAHREREPWNVLALAGFAGLIVALAYQLRLLWRPDAVPAVPEAGNRALLWLALWIFAFPAVWGYSWRFLPSILGLRKPAPRLAWAGLGLLAASIVWKPLALAAVAAACASLRIFQPSIRPAKTLGVDRRYPWFVRLAFVWLVIAASLALGESVPGVGGASRHAFTVGFLSTLIFSIGPRILPSFLNSRELWSPRLMLWALATLTAGCALRVASEPLAYSGAWEPAWRLLPVSALLEFAAVLLFFFNIGATLASPMPAWIVDRTVHENLPLYWYVTAYPAARGLLVRGGLKTLERTRRVPRSLTLREAAEADGVDWRPLVRELRAFFARRLARGLRATAPPADRSRTS